MGLSVIVGPLSEAIKQCDLEWIDYVKEDQDEINDLLKSNNILDEHIEPETLQFNDSRAEVDGFPYSFLHYLRRANAYKRQGKDDDFAPLDNDRPTNDPVLKNYVDTSSHLNTHSDCDGYYVPKYFKEVMVDECDSIPGIFVGSSQAMMRELMDVASLIGISLCADGTLSDEEIESINADSLEGEHPLWRERVAWVTLFEATRLSIKNSAFILFG